MQWYNPSPSTKDKDSVFPACNGSILACLRNIIGYYTLNMNDHVIVFAFTLATVSDIPFQLQIRKDSGHVMYM